MMKKMKVINTIRSHKKQAVIIIAGVLALGGVAFAQVADHSDTAVQVNQPQSQESTGTPPSEEPSQEPVVVSPNDPTPQPPANEPSSPNPSSPVPTEPSENPEPTPEPQPEPVVDPVSTPQNPHNTVRVCTDQNGKVISCF